MEKLWNFFSGDLYEPCLLYLPKQLIRVQISKTLKVEIFFLHCFDLVFVKTFKNNLWRQLTSLPISPLQPPRTAHPMVQFSCQPSEPLVIENLPFDKYELEPSPLTQYILERRQPNTCWQVCKKKIMIEYL